TYLNPNKVNKFRTKIITATIIEICSNLAPLTSSYFLYLILQMILPIANKGVTMVDRKIKSS
ncbi:hypothetical protein ACLBVB_37065, partial [Pseudomonas aeruginosa]|uniref:hypothetical protein n=1 Tax=Pseudomonas aeruginosa TaxID=287 RepID=UPI003968195E